MLGQLTRRPPDAVLAVELGCRRAASQGTVEQLLEPPRRELAVAIEADAQVPVTDDVVHARKRSYAPPSSQPITGCSRSGSHATLVTSRIPSSRTELISSSASSYGRSDIVKKIDRFGDAGTARTAGRSRRRAARTPRRPPHRRGAMPRDGRRRRRARRRRSSAFTPAAPVCAAVPLASREPAGDVAHVVLEDLEPGRVTLDLVAGRVGDERRRAGVGVPVHVGEVVERRARHGAAQGPTVGRRLAVERDGEVERTAR